MTSRSSKHSLSTFELIVRVNEKEASVTLTSRNQDVIWRELQHERFNFLNVENDTRGKIVRMIVQGALSGYVDNATGTWMQFTEHSD